MAGTRILFVDDEPGIRTTLTAILEHHGYNTTAAATVPEALHLISHYVYDVLISDLNIGEPGDGFTVVSAMRRTQPKAVTFILTGFPGFESALRAIQEQVDGYLIKPTRIADLINELESKLANPGANERPKLKRVSDVVRAVQNAILDEWLQRLRSLGSIGSLHLTNEQLTDGVPVMLDELAASVETGVLSPRGVKASHKHGLVRRAQGYTVMLLLEDSRVLRQVILRTVHIHLLEINLSFVFEDLGRMSDSLDEQLEIALSAFLETKPS